MGQHLSSINSQIVNLLESNCSIPSPTAVVSSIGSEDVSLFLSSEISSNAINDKYQISKQWTKQIQNYLYHLIHIPDFEIVNTQMNSICTSILTDYQQIIQELNNDFEKKEQFKISLLNKLKNDNDNKQQSSLASKLSTLFKFAEKNALPGTHHLHQSIIIDSSASSNRVTEKQFETILNKFLTSNKSLKNILFVLNKFLFDTNNVYDLRNILTQFNDRFSGNRREWENEQMTNNNKTVKQTIDAKLFAHLTLIGAYPNSRLKNMVRKQFTGQFISFFIFTHINFHNTINTNKQFNSGSIDKSMSFEFHPDTYKQLFDIIKQLSVISTKDLNINLIYILIVCLRLFATHLKFLFVITTNSFNNLLLTNENRTTINRIDQEINLNELTISNDDLQLWFDTLLILACQESIKPEQTTINSQASKCLIQILDRKVSSFTEKLSFIHQYVSENKYFILVEELLIEFNTNTTLFNWIDVLCNNNFDNTNAFNILYLFLDIYFNPSNDMKPRIKQQIQQIIQRFQQLIFMQLSSTYSLANKYISYILNNFNSKSEIVNDLLNPILIGLGLMTETHFNFTTIQAIITYVLPLLAEFILKNSINENIIANNLHYIYWLLGKMSYILIGGPQNNVLEIKYIEKLQSPLFAGGCEKLTIESNQYLLNLFESNIVDYIQLKTTDYNFEQSLFDHEFLMSIYNNINQGAQLISKIKMFIKDKQYLLQKSIEQQANHACAALFAVYIKFFRRINLAKYELTRTDDKKPHKKLLSIFEYATHVYILFARTKGQGGNCDELYDQIKMNTLFLLTSIKENY
ncbi:unnamed protein product [Rotaria sp. Silwood2]|nr:unnamed protein product [Rotaria sp. Silwood2]